MPIEYRAITFSNEELLEALLLTAEHLEAQSPNTRISLVRPSKTKSGYLAINFVANKGEPIADEVYLHSNDVKAALIKFCEMKSIPIAQIAEKAIAVDGCCISLVMRIALPQGSEVLPITPPLATLVS